MKVFNKYKAPKYTEFSRKDFVVDIKAGHLYFKSNLGVHKVGSFLDTSIFGTQPPSTYAPTSEFEWISVSDWALVANIQVYGTASFQGANTYIGGSWVTNLDGTTDWSPQCTDNLRIGGKVTASCAVKFNDKFEVHGAVNATAIANSIDTANKVLVINTTTGRIYRTGSYIGVPGVFPGDITSVNITAGAGLLGTVNTPAGDHNQSLSITSVAGTSGINVLANGIEVDVSDFMANGTDNWLLTATGTDTFQAESGLMYDGSFLTLTGNISASGAITASGAISSSGLLFSSASQGFDNISIYNSSSGQYHYTSSQGLSNQLDTFKTTGQRVGSSSITGSFTVIGHTTSSGNISSSGADYTFGTTRMLDGHITASGDISASGTGSFSHLIVDGDAVITGRLTAQEFHTEFVSSSILFESGSTIFGNSADDTHTFSGSITASDAISASGLLYASASIGSYSNVTMYHSESGRFYYTSSIGLSAGLDTFKVTGQRSGSSSITGSLTLSGSGNITASGNISASGTLYGNEAYISGSITSSGNISASGLLYASASLGNYPNVAIYHSESGQFFYTSSAGLLGATFKQTGQRSGSSVITGSFKWKWNPFIKCIR